MKGKTFNMINKDNYFHNLSVLRSHKMPNVRTLTDPQNAYMGNIILNIETGTFYGFNGTDWIILGNSTTDITLTSPSSIGASLVINGVAPDLTIRTLESSDGSITIVENADTIDLSAQGSITIDIVDDLSSPPDIDLLTDYTLFNNPTSFSLDGSLNPEYILDNSITSIEKNLALLNPKSGNVTIKTSLGSFNLTFDHQYEKLVFDTENNLWKKLTSGPYYVTTQQGSDITNLNSVINELLGQSVSLSADGNTLAIGIPGYTSNQGGVFVFIRSLNVWIFQTLAPLQGANGSAAPQQGYSVSLSADGNTLAVGGRLNDVLGVAVGGTWVFTRTAGVWTAQTASPLIGTGNTGASAQGTAVSLSADGNTLAVGGPGDAGNIGALWVFTRTAGVWTQQAGPLIEAANFQGTSVSLSADGNTLAVGAPIIPTGQTLIYTRIGTIWSFTEALIGTLGILANQGRSVSLSANGNTLAIGSDKDDTNIGATWIFTRNGTTWTQQGGKIIGTNAGTYNQGWSVSLSADGNTLAITGFNTSGLIWIFTRSDTIWTQQGDVLTMSGALFTSSETSVNLSADGNTMAVGQSGPDSSRGSVSIYI